MTSDEKTIKPMVWTPWAAACLPAIFTFLASFFVLMIAGMRQIGEGVQEAGTGFYLVLLATMASVVVMSVLLFLMARGKAVPSAIGLLAGLTPWIAGLGAARAGASRVAQALLEVDPAQRALLTAQGIAESSIALSYGALLSGALLAALALGSALAAFGRRAPERRGVFALFALLGLPLLGISVLASPKVEGGWLLILPALLSFAALGLAGGSLGRGEAAARAGALAATTPTALGLSFVATGVSLQQHAMQMALAAMAAADAPSRVIFALRAADEVGRLGDTVLYAALVSIVAALAFVALAAPRSPITPARIAGTAAAVFALTVGLALPRLPPPDLGLAEASTQAEGADTTLSTSSGVATGEGPELVLTPRGLHEAGTQPAAGATREAMLELLTRLRPPNPDSEYRCGRVPYDALRVALAPNLPGAVLQTFAQAAAEAQIGAVVWIAKRPTLPEEEARLDALARQNPLLARIVRTPYTEVEMITAGPMAESCLEVQQQWWSADLGSTALETLTARDGETRSLVAPPEDRSSDWAPRDLVQLGLTPTATPESLFETATRVRSAGLLAVLMPRPAPSAEASAPPTPTGPTLTMGAGPRTRASIASTIHSLQPRLRSCFEQELQRDPSFSIHVSSSFAIQPNGRTGTVEIESEDTSGLESHPRFAPCLENVMSAAQFVPDAAGGETRVRYPLIFNTAN